MTPKHLTAILSIVLVLSACTCGGSRTPAGKACSLETSAKFTTVNTASGPVAGYIENGVFTYKGIPYAKAERFMPPTDPEPWSEVRPSRAYGPTCPRTSAPDGGLTTRPSPCTGTTASPMRTASA